jgi:vacuolar-type H+-ATPase subunit E/Vma4
MEEQKASFKKLRHEIVSRAEEEADRILKQAEKDTQAILDKARAQAEAFREEQLRQAGLQAEATEKRVLSGVHLERKRRNLQMREQVVGRVLERVRERFEEFRKSPKYGKVLESWILEGIQALDGKEFRIVPGDVERRMLKPALLRDLEKRAAGDSGKKLTLGISEETHSETGVVVAASDGSMRFDNRLSARLDRMMNTIRLIVMKHVLQETEEKASSGKE